MNMVSLSRLALASAIGAGALLLGGCATTQGDTVEEQRNFVMDTHDETLRDLYRQRPEAREKVENAPGYGVFSAIDTNIILVAAGGGYGVVVDNATGERTYMRMGEGGVGPGIGLKDTRIVMVFHNDQRLHEFVESGWEFGGSADATAEAGEQGAGAETRGTITRDIEVYQLTESGVSLQATLRGTRFWRDRELNQTQHN
jgi:lipid-binding SYLF domain-containing protein